MCQKLGICVQFLQSFPRKLCVSKKATLQILLKNMSGEKAGQQGNILPLLFGHALMSQEIGFTHSYSLGVAHLAV